MRKFCVFINFNLCLNSMELRLLNDFSLIHQEESCYFVICYFLNLESCYVVFLV